MNSDTTAIDQRVYQRGGLALRALRTGSATSSVATGQFVAPAQRFAAEDLTGFFAAWLQRKALPALAG